MNEQVSFSGGKYPTFGEWIREYNSIANDTQFPKRNSPSNLYLFSRTAFEGLNRWSEKDDDVYGLKLQAGSVIAATAEIFGDGSNDILYGVSAVVSWMAKTPDYQHKFLGLDISGGLLALDGEGLVLPASVRSHLGSVPQEDVPDLVQRGAKVADVVRAYRRDNLPISFDQWAGSTTVTMDHGA